jgi:hypothetical protein
LKFYENEEENYREERRQNYVGFEKSTAVIEVGFRGIEE